MSSIVAGRFASTPEAEAVAQKLYARGFSVWDVSVMALDPGNARPAGVLLAARAKGERRDEAVDVLREAGAADVECAKGKWEGGQWADFDPTRAPTPIADQATPDAAGAHGAHGARGDHAKPVAEEAVAEESTGNEDPGSELEHFVDRQVASHS